MLDKSSKRILREYYISRYVPLETVELLARLHKPPQDFKIAFAFRYLTEVKYIKLAEGQNGENLGFLITQEGILAYEERKSADFDKYITRGLSIAALIISLIALLMP